MALKRDDIEQRLRKAALTGELLELGSSREADSGNGENENAQRTLDAAVLVDVLTRTDRESRPRAVRLAGAHITGSLDLEAAEVGCPVFLKDCWLEESVILTEASTRALRFPGCHFPFLVAHNLTTRGNLELDKGFASRMVFLAGARIGGALLLSGADLNNPDDVALFADGLVVEQSMICRKGVKSRGSIRISGGFKSRGGIRISGGDIGGNLELDGATLTNPNGQALVADGLQVRGSLFCRDKFRAEGEVRLSGAHIGGSLDLNGATLIGTKGRALTAGGLTVGQSMTCGKRFNAEGELFLVGVQVGGNLELSSATLRSSNDALIGDALNVGNSMFFTDEFSAQGKISLTSATIKNQLSFDTATFSFSNGPALQLQELQAGSLVLRNVRQPAGEIDLTHANVDTLADEPASWPRHIQLRGFVYDSLFERSRVSVHQRLDLLNRDPNGFAPQPYEQLASVYRRAGREQDARTVAIGKQRARRGNLSLPGRAWSQILGAVVGHGYRTWLAGVWLLGLIGIGAAVFASAHPNQMALAKKAGDPVPAFQAWIYSLDVLLPVVNLHQEEFWIPEGVARWWAWFSILAGWLLTSLVLAALTGILKRD
jgi:hypothetical protein